MRCFQYLCRVPAFLKLHRADTAQRRVNLAMDCKSNVSFLIRQVEIERLLQSSVSTRYGHFVRGHDRQLCGNLI